MLTGIGCMVLGVFIVYANAIRQGAELANMFALARLIGAAQVAAGIGAVALLVMGAR